MLNAELAVVMEFVVARTFPVSLSVISKRSISPLGDPPVGDLSQKPSDPFVPVRPPELIVT